MRLRMNTFLQNDGDDHYMTKVNTKKYSKRTSKAVLRSWFLGRLALVLTGIVVGVLGVSILDALNASLATTADLSLLARLARLSEQSSNTAQFTPSIYNTEMEEDDPDDLFDTPSSMTEQKYSTGRDGSPPRIGKASMLFGRGDLYKKNADLTILYERSLATHEAHALLHKYPFFVARREILPTAWTKHAYILSLILQEMAKPEEERLEWLMWVDADTIVMNPKTPLETFLPPSDLDNIHMVIAKDAYGLNDGVFFVRVNSWSVRLFSNIIALRELRKEVRLKYIEQGAVMWMLNNPQLPQYNKSVAFVPQGWFNAYEPEWFSAYRQEGRPFTAGDHLLHLVGPTSKGRMGKWLDEAETNKDIWELDISTDTLAEVEDVWNKYKYSQMRVL